MAAVSRPGYASLAVSALALAVALGGGASWAATRTPAAKPSLTCVVVKHSGFRNGWHNLGTPFRPVQACKDALGFVHLEGVLTGGTPNTTALVLPNGYRPKFDKVFAAAAFNGGVPVLEDIFLLPGGLVFARGSAKDAVGLDGAIFIAGG